MKEIKIQLTDEQYQALQETFGEVYIPIEDVGRMMLLAQLTNSSAENHECRENWRAYYDHYLETGVDLDWEEFQEERMNPVSGVPDVLKCSNG